MVRAHGLDASAAAARERSVVAAMWTHFSSPELQSRALYSLSCMVLDDKARATLGRAGACEVVVAVMRAHSTDIFIQRSGVYVLAHLAHIPRNRRRLGHRARKLVLNRVREYPSDPMIQQWGVFALDQLTADWTREPVVRVKQWLIRCMFD
eukprot:TRINITY_DN10594_c0_g1_i1.p1 TRINITY_DN10594_c0_g1~~TRINITY_DN10594_c0_g1_i1.p1  ORF type:complete len:151 (+),score=13.64 TRINITY_DN10594_c0_g1_i1:261-713(+)